MKIPRLIRVLGLWLALTFALSAGAGPFTNGGGFGGGGGSVVSFPLLAPNGTVAAASYASSVDPTTGIFFLGAGTFDITVAGVERLRATAGVIDIGSQQLRFGPSVGTTDIVLARNAAGVFEINNGTAGTFRDLIARNITLNGGHLVTGSVAPTMGACGTSPSVAGNDNALFVTVGTGGVATSCAVNFGASWTTAPVCVAQSGTDKVSYSIVSTTSLVTVTAAAAFTASSNLNILCMGR
jgi:hypothetical protein